MTNPETPDLIRFAKSRAKKLRQYLTSQGLEISHSQSLEATAFVEGFKDWNTYAARFKLAETSIPEDVVHETDTGYPLQVGDTVCGTYRGGAFKGTLLGLEKTITDGVWRAKVHFDKPVKIPGNPALNLTRQRVRCMLNANGMSVNLAGKPDGQTAIKMP